jgi:hypothetical protein
MRWHPVSIALVAAAFLASAAAWPPATAEEVKPLDPGPCLCPMPEPPKLAPLPRYAEIARELDESDEIAALDAIRQALSQVGDGATYVWHRRNGRLSGMVQPTSSFKDAAGRVCRHIVVVLSSTARTGKVEGVACRLADGRWQLDG